MSLSFLHMEVLCAGAIFTVENKIYMATGNNYCLWLACKGELDYWSAKYIRAMITAWETRREARGEEWEKRRMPRYD